MVKAAPEVPAAKLALYEKLVALHPKIERKGAANLYTSVNGHMFSFMTKSGALALRLSLEEREAVMKKFKIRAPIGYDTVMKEYARVPEALLKTKAVRRA